MSGPFPFQEGRTMKDVPEQVDIIVGQNIRNLRSNKKLSQSALAEEIGVTFQQVQKYEKGTNRVSASKLVAIAMALDVGVETLFSGVPGASEGQCEPIAAFTTGEIALVTDYRAITNPEHRALLRDTAKKLSSKMAANAA